MSSPSRDHGRRVPGDGAQPGEGGVEGQGCPEAPADGQAGERGDGEDEDDILSHRRAGVEQPRQDDTDADGAGAGQRSRDDRGADGTTPEPSGDDEHRQPVLDDAGDHEAHRRALDAEDGNEGRDRGTWATTKAMATPR